MTNHTSLLLLEPADAVPVDFRPSSMGVVVEAGDSRYHPEFRDWGDLAQRPEIAWPQYWAYDGNAIRFDVLAPAGVRVEASNQPIELKR